MIHSLYFLLMVTTIFSSSLFAQDQKGLLLKNSVEIIDKDSIGAESVSISDDGSRLCWIAKPYDSKLVIPSQIYIKEMNTQKTKNVSRGGLLNIFVKCSFGIDNDLVTSKLHYRPLALSRSVIEGLKTKDLEPVGYVSSVTIFNGQGKVVKKIKPKDIGLENNMIFLKHPRISPDGLWLTFYLEDKSAQGIYLTHLQNGKIYKLSNQYDKHPTWTPDGKKILFHYQIDANEQNPEQAYLGYINVALEANGTLKRSQRILLDDPKKVGFKYQKHPAIITGTNLVIFHGEVAPGEKKSLFVRKLQPGSESIELKLELIDGTKITKAKHPATGSYTNPVVFIGKTKDAKDDMVLMLTDRAIKQIISTIK